MSEIEVLRKRIKRERIARKEAERLLEERALQLYYTNEQLKELNQTLEVEVQRKTAELERQKERYQMLVDSAQDIIFVISNDGYFKYVNPIAVKMMAYSEDELTAIHFSDLVAPRYLDRVKAFYKKQMQEKTPISYLEFPITCGDGREIWIGQNLSLQIMDGELVEMTAIARDISERINKDREIAELNLRLMAILSNLQEGILLEDENRKIVLANQEFCNTFHIPVDPMQMVGADCSQSAEQVKHLFVDPETFVEEVNAQLNGRKLVVDTYLELKDGRILERDFIPIFDGNRYIGHLWRYQDVTEQKQVELKIRQSEEKYRGIIENMELGLLEVDKVGIITKVYPRFCEMTGYSSEELLGEVANEVLLNDEYRAIMEAQDKKRIEGKSGAYEIKLKVKGGKEKWMMISGAPFFNFEGEMIGSIGVHYDMSHQKKLQEDLEMARQEAERARDAEKDFLANMSHEIRNPINSIVGMTNLLFDSPLNTEQLEYLNNIKYSSDLLLALISDILDISKITEGKMTPNPKPFKLKEMVKAIGKMIEFRLHQKSVRFQLSYDEQIPNPLVADTTFLNQILMNLLSNASKFTHEGFISLSIELLEETATGALVHFTVHDTGIGISENQLDHIFERFSQAGKATASQYGGTGLGLPITKKLIELLGGHISVQSELGEGTSFFFQIPFPKPTGDAISIDRESEISIVDRPLSVLIVEDSATNRLYLERTLEKWNYQYDSSHNGKEALEQLEEKEYDIILMDIRMPEMDGYETTIRLRSSRTNPNCEVPIIALTASALKDEMDKALEAGMNFHLTKPFTPDQLQKAIGQFFQDTENIGRVKEKLIEWPSPLKANELQEMYGDDLEHAEMMFQIFREEIPQEISALSKAVAEKDWEKAGDIAHKIKPNFKMVGNGALTELSAKLEALSRSDEPNNTEIEQLFTELQEQTDRTLGAVSEAREQIFHFNKQQT